MRTRLILLVVLVAALTACRDKEAEKKIAALEARLSEMEAKKSVPGQSPIQAQPQQPEQKPDGPLPIIEFEKTEHDFGTIEQGKPVSYTYKFTNTGEGPLIIQEAKPTCGCTVSDYTKEPIPVGGTGYVTANFDGKAAGVQNKSVTVTANTWPRQTTLKFKAMVTPGATPTSPAKATN